MRTRTIISIALAAVITCNAGAALAGGRTIAFKPDTTVGDARGQAAAGFSSDARSGGGLLPIVEDPNQYRHQDWQFVPLTGKVDDDPPKPGTTPGKPILPGFSPDGHWGAGKGEFEIKLACLTPGENSLRVTNIGDATVPAGLRFKWLVAKADGGAFRLNRALAPGETLTVPGYAGGRGLPCAIRAI